MFGKKTTGMTKNGLPVTLQAFTKEEITSTRVLEMLARHRVTQFTLLQNSPTALNEGEWWDKVSKDSDNWVWGIYAEEKFIGITSLMVESKNHRGSTGCIIFDEAYWGMGIATAAHTLRTFYSVHMLNLHTLTSSVLEGNEASLKALLGQGYVIIGKRFAVYFRNGKYVFEYLLQWIRPGSEHLIPENEMTPEWQEAIRKADLTLKKGLEEFTKQG